jgi:hypothetical protein
VRQRRRSYFILALATLAAGLAMHFLGAALPATVRDVAGDMLWAMLIFWLLAMAAPMMERRWTLLLAAVICVAVELSQLLRWPALDAWRSTTIGHLTLGTDFDPRDLAAYGAGIAAAVLLDRWVCRERRRPFY